MKKLIAKENYHIKGNHINMDLSIIIVNWNTKDITCDCLKSIYQNTMNITYEVIVIDNASEDESVEAIKELYPSVILIENQKNEGFASANNIGMEISKGNYFLLLNSDTVVLGDVIEKTFDYVKGKERIGMLGCRVINSDRTTQNTCFMYPSVLNMLISSVYLNKFFPLSKIWGREAMTWWKRDTYRQVQTVTGCFIMVSRNIVSEIGMMDCDFFMYGEETDWCYRCEEAGYTNEFAPVGEIIHLGGASTSQVRPKMILQLRSGILYFIKKNKSYVEYLVCCLLTAFWFLNRVPYWLFKSIVSNERKTSSLVMKTYIKGFLLSFFGYKALSAKL